MIARSRKVDEGSQEDFSKPLVDTGCDDVAKSSNFIRLGEVARKIGITSGDPTLSINH